MAQAPSTSFGTIRSTPQGRFELISPSGQAMFSGGSDAEAREFAQSLQIPVRDIPAAPPGGFITESRMPVITGQMPPGTESRMPVVTGPSVAGPGLSASVPLPPGTDLSVFGGAPQAPAPPGGVVPPGVPTPPAGVSPITAARAQLPGPSEFTNLLKKVVDVKLGRKPFIIGIPDEDLAILTPSAVRGQLAQRANDLLRQGADVSAIMSSYQGMYQDTLTVVDKYMKDLENRQKMLREMAFSEPMLTRGILPDALKATLSLEEQAMWGEMSGFYKEQFAKGKVLQPYGNYMDEQTGDLTILFRDPVSGEITQKKITGVKTPTKDTDSIADQLKAIEAGYTVRDGKLVRVGSGADPITGVPTDASKVIAGFNFTSYATDPNWGNAVNRIMGGMPKFTQKPNQSGDIDEYIARVAPKSPLVGKGGEIARIADENGIPKELLVAMMQHESQFGTAGAGAKTFNPGNVGNTDTGATVNMGTWERGIEAMAKNVVQRRQAVGGLSLSPLAQQIKNDPSILATLTPSEQTKIRKEFAANGITVPETLDLDGKIKLQKDLKSEFSTAAKDTRTAMQQVKIMNASIDEARKDAKKLNAASQGVLVVFQKMLDPTSVVRESEYARSGTGLSLSGRMEGALEKLKKGGAGLTLDDLQDFVDVGNQYFEKVYKAAILDQAAIIEATSDKYGLDLDLILTPEIRSLMRDDVRSASGGTPITLPSGRTVTIPNY